MDTDRKVSAKELQRWIMAKTAEHFQEAVQESRAHFRAVDPDGDGRVSWDEYKVKFLASKGHDEREVAEKIQRHAELKVDEESECGAGGSGSGGGRGGSRSGGGRPRGRSPGLGGVRRGVGAGWRGPPEDGDPPRPLKGPRPPPAVWKVRVQLAAGTSLISRKRSEAKADLTRFRRGGQT